MEKIKRNCVVCKKRFDANRYHGLDKESMGKALACPKCRDNYISGKK